MDILGFDHVNLTVRNFDESVDWYGRLFHFRVVEEGVSDGVRWGILRSRRGTGDQMLCLYEYPDRTFLDRHELRARGIHGVSHFGIRIDDESEWVRTLERERIEAVPWAWPHSRAWYVNDPTGYEIEVVSWKENTVRFGDAKAQAGSVV